MDSWLLIFLSLFLTIALSVLSKYLNKHKNKKLPLPPGPPSLPFLIKFFFQCRSLLDIVPLVRQEYIRKYGPIITLPIGTDLPMIFISDRRIAHQMLIQRAVIFSHRPEQAEPGSLFTNKQRDITSAKYGPYWRQVRRNMSVEIMHPARIKQFTPARRWALQILLEDLRDQANANAGVVVGRESFNYAMFSLLVLMCFGEKVDKASIKEIEETQHFALCSTAEFPIFSFFPTITKLIFRRKWNKFVAARKTLEKTFFQLIRLHKDHKSSFVSYVDTLLSLHLPEENNQKLQDADIVSLCIEFLDAGTDTTKASIEWIMAELVKHSDVQAKLFNEIQELVRDHEKKDVITEEEVQSLPYLKAVVMEGLRRHPPSHLVAPHTVNEDIELEGYLIPKGSHINFMVAEIGWDDREWKDPLEFRPERFLDGGEGENVDIRGITEIKMMPFGIGRRMCPGFELGLLHLGYFVGNLVWKFEWKPMEGEEVDMTERVDFSVIMNNPLRAAIVPRR